MLKSTDRLNEFYTDNPHSNAAHFVRIYQEIFANNHHDITETIIDFSQAILMDTGYKARARKNAEFFNLNSAEILDINPTGIQNMPHSLDPIAENLTKSIGKKYRYSDYYQLFEPQNAPVLAYA